METNEDRRQAAAMVVSLSQTVTTVTLALLAGSVALSTFVLDKYEVQWTFWALGTLAAGAFGMSTYFGGRGVWDIVQDGESGRWSTTPRRYAFGKQNLLAVAGSVLLFVATIVATTADSRRSEPDRALERIAARASAAEGLSVQVGEVSALVDRLRAEQAALEERVRELER